MIIRIYFDITKFREYFYNNSIGHTGNSSLDTVILIRVLQNANLHSKRRKLLNEGTAPMGSISMQNLVLLKRKMLKQGKISCNDLGIQDMYA